MLRIEHLTKTFGKKVAVDDLSLHIAPGEIYGFIGHNGAGKTTTLRSAVGIQQFDKGEIYICGTSVRTDPIACKRQLAYIPDNPDLYEFMSGIRYLNFIADVYGMDAQTRAQRIRDYAERLELTFETRNILFGNSFRMYMIFDSVVFCRQTESIPADRIEYVIALHPAFSRNDIKRSV